MRIENWNGHAIRFAGKDGEWWAAAKDVCDALDINNPSQAVINVQNRLNEAGITGIISNEVCLPVSSGKRRTQKFLCVNETGLYELALGSRKKEAVSFRYWITSEVLPELRKSLGLSGYEAFRLMDKEHQKEAMKRLNESLHEPVKVDYIKANIIADKAVSAKYGFPKLVKKGAMDEAMLRDRQPVLDDTVQLMSLNERFGLGLSVSGEIYKKYKAI